MNKNTQANISLTKSITCPRCLKAVNTTAHRADLANDLHTIPTLSAHKGSSADGHLCLMSGARVSDLPEALVSVDSEAHYEALNAITAPLVVCHNMQRLSGSGSSEDPVVMHHSVAEYTLSVSFSARDITYSLTLGGKTARITYERIKANAFNDRDCTYQMEGENAYPMMVSINAAITHMIFNLKDAAERAQAAQENEMQDNDTDSGEQFALNFDDTATQSAQSAPATTEENAPAPAPVVDAPTAQATAEEPVTAPAQENAPALAESLIYAVVAEDHDGVSIQSLHKTQQGALKARRAITAQYDSVTVITLVDKGSRRGARFISEYYDAQDHVMFTSAYTSYEEARREAASFPYPEWSRYSLKTFKAHLSI